MKARLILVAFADLFDLAVELLARTTRQRIDPHLAIEFAQRALKFAQLGLATC